MPQPLRTASELTPVGNILGAFLDALISPEQRQLASLRRLWKMPHLEPVSLQDGILGLKAKSSAWKHSAQLQKNTIVKESNRLLGSIAVKGIKVV
jgi:hypothetical protein